MTNVVVFPKAKRGSPANSIDEILELVEIARREQIEMLIDETMSMIFCRCYQDSFNLTDDAYIKSTAMVVESLRAALYRTSGLHHPLHEVADEMFLDEKAAMLQTDRILDSEQGPDVDQ